jgi:hypothetical protein
MALRRHFSEIKFSYVVIDLTLTFVGVLSALAVDNFRESLSENAREKEYLIAFRDALKSDTATINTELERCFFKLNAAGKFIDLIEKQDSTSNADFEDLTLSILMLIDPAYNTATYEDLKSTGNSRIIRNADLRNDIIAHYTYLNKLMAIQQSSTSAIAYNAAFMDQFTYEEFTQLRNSSSEEVIGRLRNDKEATLYLKRLRKEMIIYRNSLLYSALPKTLALLEKVDAEVTQ